MSEKRKGYSRRIFIEKAGISDGLINGNLDNKKSTGLQIGC